MFQGPLLSLDDVSAAYAGQPGLDFEFMQLAPGHLGYCQTSVSIGDVTISKERVGKPMRVHLRAAPDVVTISFMLGAGGAGFWRGHEIEKTHALVFGEAENEYILPRDLYSVNITAPVRAFDTLGLPRLQSGLWRTADAPRRVLITIAGAALAGQHMTPGTDATLMAAMCDALSAEPGALTRHAAAPDDATRQFRLLQRAEQLRPDASVRIDAIAKDLGTSPRSLHRAFKDLSGLGPQRYLRIVRLHQFRERLFAGGSNDTITRLAYDFGFENMGRLSGQYRDWFGELPRETRRRRQSE